MFSVTQIIYLYLGEHGIPHGPDHMIQLFNISPFNNLFLGASNIYLALATDITPQRFI